MRKLFAIFIVLLMATYVYAMDSHVTTLVTDIGNVEMENWADLPVASTQAFTGVDGIYITTATLIGDATSLYDGATYSGNNTFAQITFPRNIRVELNFYGTDNSNDEVTSCNLVVYGQNTSGEEIIDTIAFSTNTGYGLEAFATVSTFVVVGISCAGVTASSVSICIGTSNKIGLAGDIRQVGDLTKFTNADVDFSTTTPFAVNVFYNTIDLGATCVDVPDNSIDYKVWWRRNVWH